MVVMGLLSPVLAQQRAERFEPVTKELLHSQVLNEDRNVYISLPEGYSQNTGKYPVLYMLYSEASHFHFNAGVVTELSRMQLIPNMAVVAVDLGDGKRDLTPTPSPDYGPTSGGAANFLKFLKDELIPFVDENYRTNSERLYWSHSIGGLFGLYALLKEPGVFQSVLISSPFFVYDRDKRYIIKNTKAFLQDRKGRESFLYICVGDEPRLISEIEAFLNILNEVRPIGLTWKIEKMPQENHMSIMALSLKAGLRAYGSK